MASSGKRTLARTISVSSRSCTPRLKTLTIGSCSPSEWRSRVWPPGIPPMPCQDAIEAAKATSRPR